MPTYEYRCCGEFEENVPVDDRDSVKCPKCGHKAERLLPRSIQVNSSTDFIEYDSGGLMAAYNAKHRDFNERAIAADNVKEYTVGKDHRQHVRPERIRELKEQAKKCPQQAQSA